MTEVRTLSAGPGVGEEDRGRAVRAAAGALAEGGLLVHPTETVYGIGALSPELDAGIARLKGRPPGRPLLRIGHDAATIRRRHPELEWGEAAERLAGAFWPGPLTLVLDDGGEDGLGVRAEAHPMTCRVLAELGATMSSTSLNESGAEPAAAPDEVREVLEALPEAGVPVTWLDAGPLPGGPPSTVLSLRGGSVRLLRAGAVGKEALERVLDGEVADG